MQTVLVTGAAGFIGAAVSTRLLAEGFQVVGVDSVNDYYDVRLKEARLKRLAEGQGAERFVFEKLNLADREKLLALVMETKPEVVVHLAAQAGVRYGLENPLAYLESNLVGHINVLEVCRQAGIAGHPVQHLLYASSSSVYGANEKVPFEESDDVSRPQSLYAATKRSNELLTQAWVHQFAGHPGAFPATGLRFFTVYGPWGRPDMSPMIFAKCILEKRPIPLFNNGELWRDFTYVDDIVEAIFRLLDAVPTVATHEGTAHTFYNLGNQSPVLMNDFVKTLGEVLEVEPLIEARAWPPTEVFRTFAATQKLQAAVGWAPKTPLKTGLEKFASWYREWHEQNS